MDGDFRLPQSRSPARYRKSICSCIDVLLPRGNFEKKNKNRTRRDLWSTLLQTCGHNLFDLENLLETSKNQRFHHPFSMRFHRLAWTAVALLAVSALSSQNGEFGVILK
jgi:hypothetical protein